MQLGHGLFEPINQRLGCACANITSDSWPRISQLGSLSQLRVGWENPVNQISAEEKGTKLEIYKAKGWVKGLRV